MPAVLFDLDGTLADTLDDIAFACNRILRQFGLPTHGREAYRYFVGEGVRRLIERAVPDGRADLVEPVLAEYLPYLIAHGADRATLYPGVAEMLDALAQRKVTMAVLSNKPHDSVTEVVAKLADRWRFDAVRGQRDPEPRKPDPTVALRIADQVNVAPGDCYFVGDTRVDMETATNAGMVGVGCLWGFRDRAELEHHGAKAIIAEPMQLLDVIDAGR